MVVEGSCHCRNIRYSLSWEPDPEAIPARACSCTFCTRHGAVWTSNPGGALSVAVADPARVSRYAFGTRTAEFHLCTSCGVVVVATSLIEGRLYAVVNVNALENVDPALLRRAPASFDGESEAVRLARRARSWIARVEIVAANRG